MSEIGYLPALRFRFLTAAYDPLIRWTTREETFRRRLIEQAGLRPGQRVLDIGCGTGTLALMIKQAELGAEVMGLDADSAMLSQANAKAVATGAEIRFVEGRSDELPYESASFDRVFTSLFFHHLTDGVKRATIAEIARVLRPGGELHVADWGRPSDPVMRVLSWQIRLFDGREPTRANLAGALPVLLEDGGLANASETGRLRTAFGTLALYEAQKPDGTSSTR